MDRLPQHRRARDMHRVDAVFGSRCPEHRQDTEEKCVIGQQEVKRQGNQCGNDAEVLATALGNQLDDFL